MIFSLNMKEFYNNNIIIFLLLFLYSTIWLVANDAFLFHRDEMWYSMYSLYFDSSQTSDVRYITDNDIHQIAYLPFFRYLQGTVLEIFGQNIYSLRVINLCLAIIALFATLKTFQRYKIHIGYLLLFILIISFDTQVITLAHRSRPDFGMSMLALTSLVLMLLFLKNKKLETLLLSSLSANLAATIYWNGLAVVGAFAITLFAFFVFKRISAKQFLYLTSFSIFIFIIFFILPIYNNFEIVQETFNNSGLTKSSGSFHWSNLIIMLKDSISGGLYQKVLALFFCCLIYTNLLNCFSKNHEKIVPYIFLFLIILLTIVSFRSNGARHLYIFLPVIYSMLFFSLKELDEKYKKHKVIVNLFFCIVLFLNIGNSTKNIIKNYGQTNAYKDYAGDINEIVKTDGLVMARYSAAWAINNPKFYIANFNFKEFQSQEEFDDLIKNFKLRYLIIDEPTRQRMENPMQGENWHRFLKDSLSRNYRLKKIFYNKFYIRNKLYKHRYKKGYKNEIWEYK